MSDDRQRALVLAAEAYRREPSPQTLGALQRVLSSTGSFLGVVASGHKSSGVYWASNDVVIAVGPDGLVLHDMTAQVELARIDAAVAERLEVGFGGRVVPFALAAFTTDGGLAAMAVAEDPSIVEVRELPSGRVVATMPHGVVLEQLAFAASGQRLVTLDADGEIRFFDAATWELVASSAAHPEETLADQQLPEGLPHFFGENSNIWPTSSLQAVIQPLPDGRVLSTRGHHSKLWDPITGKQGDDFGGPLFHFQGAELAGFASAAHPIEGDRLVEPLGATVVVRDLVTGQWLAQYQVPGTNLVGGPNVADSVALPGNRLWALVSDGQLVLIDSMTGEPLGPNTVVDLSEVVGLALSPDATRLAVSGNEGVAIIAADGRQLLARSGPRDGADLVELIDDEHVLRGYSGLAGYEGFPLMRVEENGLVPVDAIFRGARNRDMDGGNLVLSLGKGSDAIDGFAIVDPETLEQLSQGEQPEGLASSVAQSTDGRYFASGLRGGIVLYEIATGQEIRRFSADVGAVPSLSFDPRGGQLVATFDNRGPAMLTVPGLEESEHPLPADTTAARWATDGSWFFAVDSSKQAWLHDPISLERIRPLAGSLLSDTASRLNAYSIADGALILAEVASRPQLYDAETGLPIGGTFPIDRGLTPDGADGVEAAVTAVGEHILMWNLEVDTWFDLACRAAGRNMTAEEWEQFGPRDEPYRATCSQWPALG